MPVFLSGGSPKVSRSWGKEAIRGMFGFAPLLLQWIQSLTSFLTNDFPRGIQYCGCTKANVCSHPTWECFSWRSWTNNLVKGCVGERINWCFAWKGIQALFSRPPTLITPSIRNGCNGSSGLLLENARFAWRSLYSSSNNSIWAWEGFPWGHQCTNSWSVALEAGSIFLPCTLAWTYTSSITRTTD